MDKTTRSRGHPRVSKKTRHGGSSGLRFGWAALFSLLVVIFFIGSLWLGKNFDFKTGLFPWVIGVAILALAISQLILDCLGKGNTRSADDYPVDAESELPVDVVNRRTAVIFGWIVGFFIAIWLLGFVIGGALASFVQLKFGARERWSVTLALTLFAWAFLYVFFERILHTPFPPGKLFVWLNLPLGAD